MRVGGKNNNFVGSCLLIETDKHIEADYWNRGLKAVCILKVGYLYLYTGFMDEKIPLPTHWINALISSLIKSTILFLNT